MLIPMPRSSSLEQAPRTLLVHGSVEHLVEVLLKVAADGLVIRSVVRWQHASWRVRVDPAAAGQSLGEPSPTDANA